jgi:hypothetical protein
MLHRMSHVVTLGADDRARVRMPSADERLTYGIAEDEPVVEIPRWNGTSRSWTTYGKPPRTPRSTGSAGQRCAGLRDRGLLEP